MTSKELRERLQRARLEGKSLQLTTKQLQEIQVRLASLEAFKENIKLQKKQWGGIDKRSTTRGLL